MVVISLPASLLVLVTHERMAVPFWSTVQAPHSAIPHPNLVPVRPRTSRKYHSSGSSGSPSKECSTPLTLNRTISSPRLFLSAQDQRITCRPTNPLDQDTPSQCQCEVRPT